MGLGSPSTWKAQKDDERRRKQAVLGEPTHTRMVSLGISLSDPPMEWKVSLGAKEGINQLLEMVEQEAAVAELELEGDSIVLEWGSGITSIERNGLTHLNGGCVYMNPTFLWGERVPQVSSSCLGHRGVETCWDISVASIWYWTSWPAPELLSLTVTSDAELLTCLNHDFCPTYR